ncbi:hypothetical protein HY29_12580 [Hyphomonas beringensis]|uniref:Peptidase S9 prolyl oligopeptidase catalytic domain-containing protein n=1 Tax=Hyphomonas beringensis TaxID=1280946 RepID=A0A062UGW5_9PROT|nr:prolyl oligopeptidase family serine peptidase [Hyphomonas beringensis]KCZ55365.1 hypothetical protein HY29_12580 [Hyphomonas beringensis]
MSISPDGNLVAFITRADGADLVTIYDARTGQLNYRLKLTDLSTRSLGFADNEHLIIVASDTERVVGIPGQFEKYQAYSYNLQTGNYRPLLRETKGLHPAQSGLSHIIGWDAKNKNTIFMAAWMGTRDPEYTLLRANLDNGRGRRAWQGTSNTINFYVDTDGTVLAREEYDNRKNIYRITTWANGKEEVLYEVEAPQVPISLRGVKSDKSGLLFVKSQGANEDAGFDELYELSFSGEITSLGLGREGMDIDGTLTDGNGFVVGVRYSGALPSYKFFDPEIDQSVQSLLAAFPASSIRIVDWTSDWSKILYLFNGSDTTGSYILEDRATGGLTRILDQRTDIPKESIGEIMAINYPARDGLMIPSILTLPAGKTFETTQNAPLVVIPHGGPAAYDYVGFDWMAQYFANRGYLVLQPNFRGSTGYGQAHTTAGYGQWGKAMQDDVTDGVKILINEGKADPERVCIAGASYGGYSALAGGAYTPDLYKCVISIAGVSDLPAMLRQEVKDAGGDHWVVDYWKTQMGDPDSEDVDLDAISPATSAAAFQAPVLLIHGRDDTVVPIRQSRIMEDALKSAGKDVTFIELKGEDHWLSSGETRLATLQAMADFVDQHMGQ